MTNCERFVYALGVTVFPPAAAAVAAAEHSASPSFCVGENGVGIRLWWRAQTTPTNNSPDRARIEIKPSVPNISSDYPTACQ